MLYESYRSDSEASQSSKGLITTRGLSFETESSLDGLLFI
jgi:hypothetical protein